MLSVVHHVSLWHIQPSDTPAPACGAAGVHASEISLNIDIHRRVVLLISMLTARYALPIWPSAKSGSPHLARCPSALRYSERVANHVNNINKPRTSQNNDWPRILAACTRINVQVTHQHLLVAPQACMQAVASETRHKQRHRRVVLLISMLTARYALPSPLIWLSAKSGSPHHTRCPSALGYSECVANHENDTNKPRTSHNNDWPRASAACTRINVQVTHQQLL